MQAETAGMSYTVASGMRPSVTAFRRAIRAHYRASGRPMPWRRTRDPYRIFVSEVMLQQTQVDRVTPKYRAFVRRFPGFGALARASLREVLEAWQGLGYNRRGRALREAAAIVVAEHGGVLPRGVAALERLPGVGPATARSIAAFAFDEPAVFVETNIRRVFIHFFFAGARRPVRDDEILALVDATLDRRNPREWYWALMDYGAMLGREKPELNSRSARWRRQPRFEGSRRQLRGAILRALLARSPLAADALARETGGDAARVGECLAMLEREGLVVRRGARYRLE